MTRGLGERTGKTVADIESGAMPTLATAAKRLQCDLHMFSIDRDEFSRPMSRVYASGLAANSGATFAAPPDGERFKEYPTGNSRNPNLASRNP